MAEERKTEVKGSEFITVYVNAFTEVSAKSFFDEFKKAQNNKQKIVPVYIDSYGGYVDSLTAMLDVMLSYPGKVATITIGKAMSCGSVLLACGERGMRYASPNSRVMVHHISSCSYGKMPELEADIAESKRLQNQVFRLMAKRSGQPADYFLKLMKDAGNVDLFLTPESALKHQIVDFVRHPILETETITRVNIK